MYRRSLLDKLLPPRDRVSAVSESSYVVTSLPTGHSRRFSDLDALRSFLAQEYDFGSKVVNVVRRDSLSQVGISIDGVYKALGDATRVPSDGSKDSDVVFRNALSAYPLPFSDSPAGARIAALLDAEPILAARMAGAILCDGAPAGSSHYLVQRIHLLQEAVRALAGMPDPSGLMRQLGAARELARDAQAELDDARLELEHLKGFSREAETTLSNTKSLYTAHNESWPTTVDGWRSEFDGAVREATDAARKHFESKWKEFEKTVRKALELKTARSYFAAKRWWHLGGAAAWAVAFAGILWVGFRQLIAHYEPLHKALAGLFPDETLYAGVVTLAVPLFFILWLARFTVRQVADQIARRADAGERLVMLQTYLALTSTQEGAPPEAVQQHLVHLLDALFRPAVGQHVDDAPTVGALETFAKYLRAPK